jgi:putative colanic acid biosynthesis UDP-glucose lipid carrier transferase
LNTEYHDQISQPIFFKRGMSLAAPVLLWLLDALPAVMAGVMFYPLTRMYDVEFDRPFLVLSILAATFTLAILPSRSPTRQVISGRLELATNLLLRWAVLVAALLALGYITKFSENFSRRVIVTWVLLTPVLLVMLSLILQSITRALLRDAAQSRRAHRRGLHAGEHGTRQAPLAARRARYLRGGFFDDRGSDRLGCSRHAQLLGRFDDVASFVNTATST